MNEIFYLSSVGILTYIFLVVVELNKKPDFGARYGFPLAIFPIMAIVVGVFVSGVIFLWAIPSQIFACSAHLVFLFFIWKKYWTRFKRM